MPKFTAGVTATRDVDLSKKVTAIDAKRHGIQLTEDGKHAHYLVGRLANGLTVLTGMSADNEDRAEYERLWQDIALDTYSTFRSAYAHYSLLRLAVGEPMAQELWDAAMPSPDEMNAAGLLTFGKYWRDRVDPPAWISKQEMTLCSNMLWPPHYKQQGAMDGGDFWQMIVGAPF